MKAQGAVKGILIEGNDGAEYLLGFSSTQPARMPILSRRQADGSFKAVEDIHEASKVAMKQLGISEPHLIGPGWGKQLFLWTAFKEALKAFPPVPTWPTWPS
jgi:hypothetical protein